MKSQSTSHFLPLATERQVGYFSASIASLRLNVSQIERVFPFN